MKNMENIKLTKKEKVSSAPKKSLIKSILFTKQLSSMVTLTKNSFTGFFTDINERKADNKSLEGLSFMEVVERKKDPEQTVDDFIEGNYYNSYNRFIASVFLLIAVSTYIYFSWRMGVSLYLLATMSLFVLVSILNIILYSYRCYFLNKRELGGFKEFIKDYSQWLPKKPKSEFVLFIKIYWSKIRQSIKRKK